MPSYETLRASIPDYAYDNAVQVPIQETNQQFPQTKLHETTGRKVEKFHPNLNQYLHSM